jgi:hypothetical protein
MVHTPHGYYINKQKSNKFSLESIISNFQSLPNLHKKDDVETEGLKKIYRNRNNSNFPPNDCIIIVNSIRSEKQEVSEWGRVINFPVVNNKQSIAVPKQLEITIDRIRELTELDEEDEDGEVVIPTKYAIQKAIELVSEAEKLMSSGFFKAWVSSEDTGGIRLTWSKPELKKQVRLVVPPTSDQKTYLYHEHHDEYGVEYNISAKTLSNRLRRLNSKK